MDVSTFAPNSTRGASISEATRRGATSAQILTQGNWTNLGTYERFYIREAHDTPVGQLILQASLCKYIFLFWGEFFLSSFSFFSVLSDLGLFSSLGSHSLS